MSIEVVPALIASVHRHWSVVAGGCVVAAIFLTYLIRVAMNGRSLRLEDDGAQEISGGPGDFEVSGIDRQTQLFITWRCDADGPDDARRKGDQHGIVVTCVNRVAARDVLEKKDS